MRKRKTPLAEQEYDEMIREFEKAKPGKTARAFHKKYKAYGWGICFYDRYPNFHLYVSGAACVISLIALIVKIATG